MLKFIKLCFFMILFNILNLTALANTQWEKRYFVDEFGDKTNGYHYTINGEGTFSNSATRNSHIYWGISLQPEKDNTYLAIAILEYGQYPIDKPIGSTNYTVMVKDENKNITNHTFKYIDAYIYKYFSKNDKSFPKGNVKILIKPNSEYETQTKYLITTYIPDIPDITK